MQGETLEENRTFFEEIIRETSKEDLEETPVKISWKTPKEILGGALEEIA